MTKTKKPKPRWKHRCKQCTWLGTIEHPTTLDEKAPEDKRKRILPCDVFVCLEDHPLLIARYSNHENDVYAVRADDLPHSAPEISTALERAVELGILTPIGGDTAC